MFITVYIFLQYLVSYLVIVVAAVLVDIVDDADDGSSDADKENNDAAVHLWRSMGSHDHTDPWPPLIINAIQIYSIIRVIWTTHWHIYDQLLSVTFGFRFIL